MSESDAADAKEVLLRKARTHRDKAIRFDGSDEHGDALTWFVAYRGEFGWVACRGNGQWMDEPSSEEIENAFNIYDQVEMIDQSETPEQVTL